MRFWGVMKLVAFNILAIVAVFAAAEVFLRLTGLVPSVVVRPVFCPDLPGDFEPDLRVVAAFSGALRAGFNTDELGFRSNAPVAYTPGAARILCLGDSYTLGFGVGNAHTYPELLRLQLSQERPDVKVDVHNAGLLLSNILDAIDYYREKGRLLKPDLVIAQFSINDIFSDMTRGCVPRDVFRKKGLCDRPAWLTRLTRTAVYNLGAKLRYHTGRHLHEELLSCAGGDPFYARWLIAPTPEESRFLGPDLVADERTIPQVNRIWQAYKDAVAYLKALVEQDGASFLFLVIPTEQQLTRHLNGPYFAFARWARENGIACLDMTRYFRAILRNDAKELYLPGDEHTNVVGNTVIAAAVVRHLRIERRERGWSARPEVETPPLRAGHALVELVNDGGALRLLDESGILARASVDCGATLKRDILGKGFTWVGNGGADAGVVRLELGLTRTVSRVTGAMRWRLRHDPEGQAGVQVRVINGAGEALMAQALSNRSGKTDGLERSKIFEMDFAQASDAFTVELFVQTEAGLFVRNADSPNERRFELYFWEDAPAG